MGSKNNTVPANAPGTDESFLFGEGPFEYFLLKVPKSDCRPNPQVETVVNAKPGKPGFGVGRAAMRSSRCPADRRTVGEVMPIDMANLTKIFDLVSSDVKRDFRAMLSAPIVARERRIAVEAVRNDRLDPRSGNNTTAPRQPSKKEQQTLQRKAKEEKLRGDAELQKLKKEKADLNLLQTKHQKAVGEAARAARTAINEHDLTVPMNPFHPNYNNLPPENKKQIEAAGRELAATRARRKVVLDQIADRETMLMNLGGPPVDLLGADRKDEAETGTRKKNGGTGGAGNNKRT